MLGRQCRLGSLGSRGCGDREAAGESPLNIAEATGSGSIWMALAPWPRIFSLTQVTHWPKLRRRFHFLRLMARPRRLRSCPPSTVYVPVTDKVRSSAECRLWVQ